MRRASENGALPIDHPRRAARLGTPVGRATTPINIERLITVLRKTLSKVPLSQWGHSPTR